MGVVVVTHSSALRLAKLVESLPAAGADAVLVVDSGSPEGPPPVNGLEVVPLADNVGFGVAVNRGVHGLGDVDMIACLNPDVRFAGPSLSELAEEMTRRPDVGIATGPVVDGRGQRQPSAWGPTSPLRAFWFATGWQLPRLRRLVGRVRRRGTLTSAASLARDEVDVDGHVLGGAMVVRRECWDELDGFDEDYFLYWEDADLCQRARDLGWRIAVLPCTPIVHEAGTSSAGVTSAQRWQWYLEGAGTFATKHLSRSSGRRLRLALHAGRVLGRLARKGRR